MNATVTIVLIVAIAYVYTVRLVGHLEEEPSKRVSNFVHGSLRLLPITAICKAIIAVFKKKSEDK